MCVVLYEGGFKKAHPTNKKINTHMTVVYSSGGGGGRGVGDASINH